MTEINEGTPIESETLRMMGITVEDVQASDQELLDLGLVNTTNTEPKLICICGHGITRHTEITENFWSCKPSRLDCHCKMPNAVLKVQDTRLFKMKSMGPGVRHALIRGIKASAEQGKDTEWTVDVVCGNPNCRNMGISFQVLPALVATNGPSKDMLVLDPLNFYGTMTDVLLCKVCRDERS